ncbi:glutamate-5-semialdehyde dehydrogenase [Candidatus Uhrbacteria bacterium]|nr:glutamate-5-semialdehyde dehydrogenase [Candidatus Uhrbacteria bacterium]
MTPLEHILLTVRDASRSIANLSDATIKSVLFDFADVFLVAEQEILTANRSDLAKMDFDNPLRPRLELTREKIRAIAHDIRNVASLPSPLNIVLEKRTLESGIELSRVSVPLGVVGVIYEARPNVTADIFSLCFKSGNACVLKGGSDAAESSRVIVDSIKKVLEQHSIDTNVIHLITGGRAEAQEMMNAVEYIDVIIPRGGRGLITYVRQNARVPVIETGAGVVHTFLDESADTQMTTTIIHNAKVSRPSACNALDTLIVHEKKLSELAECLIPLARSEVEIFADEKSYAAMVGNYPPALLQRALPEHFGMEFLSLRMSIKTVANLDEAVEHISLYSSKHTEAILSADQNNTERFLSEVDAAVVFANTATVFTDGAQFSLGTEVGISTQKLHARGPMGLSALTSYKWIGRGSGQIRIP